MIRRNNSPPAPRPDSRGKGNSCVRKFPDIQRLEIPDNQPPEPQMDTDETQKGKSKENICENLCESVAENT